MKVSRRCIEAIKKWESFSSTPYKDAVGVWTIGYGYTRGVSADSEPIDEKDAEALLVNHVNGVVKQLNPYIKGIRLRQCQYDAILVLVYNIGIGNFLRSKTLKEIQNNPDGYRVADEWIGFRKAGGRYLRGLMRRRIDELRLYYSW